MRNSEYIRLTSLPPDEYPAWNEVIALREGGVPYAKSEEIEYIAYLLSADPDEQKRIKQFLIAVIQTEYHKLPPGDCRQYRKVFRAGEGGNERREYKVDTTTRRYSLSAEVILRAFACILHERGADRDHPILLPFGGMGSFGAVLNGLGFETIAADLLYGRRNEWTYDPRHTVECFRTTTAEKAKLILQWGSARFVGADACQLPFPDRAFRTVFGSPPFNRECPTDGDPADLLTRALQECARVLTTDGTMYFIIPSAWKESVSAVCAGRLKIRVLSDCLLPYEGIRFPLSLLAFRN